MKYAKERLFTLALAANALFLSSSMGVTIYRIGNQDLSPPPQDANLVQLSWEEASQGTDGVWDGLILANGQIAPIRVRPDENLSLMAIARGGGPRGQKYPNVEPQTEITDWTADGDPTTAFRDTDAAHRGMGNQLAMYLGGRFPVNRVRFYPSPQSSGFIIEKFRLAVSDQKGSAEVIRLVSNNTHPIVDLTFPTRIVDRLQLNVHSSRSKVGDWFSWEIAEFEVYGEGFVPEATFQSQIFDLGAPATIGPLRWSGFRDPDARVNVRTRSGRDPDPNRYWRYTGRGDEVSFRTPEGAPMTQADYDKLRGGQPPITEDLDNWSVWSGPYPSTTNAAIVSPSPRQFLQVQVGFVPKGFHGGGVDLVEFRVTQPPLSGQIVGEVWPEHAIPGAVTPFVYALRPELSPETSGFDSLVVETTGRFAAVDSVRINEEWIEAEAAVEAERIALSLPRMEAEDNQKLVEVFFAAQVFHFGTSFAGQVFDSERPGEVAQQVVPGNATFRLDGDQLSVGVQLAGPLLQQVAVQPPVITPNGDGINDQTEIAYTLLRLADAGAVEVEIFDLSGRSVRRLYSGRESSGHYLRPWDGRGDDGSVVAPGLYLFQVRLDADRGTTRDSGFIAVVY